MNHDEATQANGYYFIRKPIAFYSKLDITIEDLLNAQEDTTIIHLAK